MSYFGQFVCFSKTKKPLLRTLATRWITNLWRVRILEYTHVHESRMRKDNQTPIHSSSGYLSLCEPPDRLRVTENKCMSSSDYCEYSKVDTSTYPYFC